jgi:purine-binding chemotaxis protein CheW
VSRIAHPPASTLPILGPRDGDRVAAGSDRYLTFALAGQTYAPSILDVTEIMGLRGLTVVPMMPSFIRGVINLRGKVVPVVDMAARFGREITTIAPRDEHRPGRSRPR